MRFPSKTFWRFLLALFFIIAGTNHFLNPKPYLTMMPAYLPWSRALIQISGIAEILGGIGVLIPALRKCAGWGLIALLIAVFPANLQVAIHGWPGMNVSPWLLWLRLPFQLLFIWWVYTLCLSKKTSA